MRWPFVLVGLVISTAACGDSPSRQDLPSPPPFEVRGLSVPVRHTDGSTSSVSLRYFWQNETGREDPPVLVFQFGGPGSSAVAFLSAIAATLPPPIVERYALVALDEIGVGGSAPIDCPDLGQVADEAFAHPYVGSSSVALRQPWSASVPECLEGYPYAALISTERHAQDLERLRVALGVERLSFLAFSYGTRVALAYAALYPDRAGRLVLDSPVDPRATYLDQLREQAAARARTLERFVDACEAQAQGCGFTRQAFLTAFDALTTQPPPVALAYARFLDAAIFEPRWPRLAADLAILLGDLDAMGRRLNTNIVLAAPPSFIGTLCADTRVEGVAAIEAEAAALRARDTVFPPAFFADAFNGAYACLYWPTAPATIDWPAFFSEEAPGLDIMLVGASDDFLSPAVFADALADAMPTAARIQVDEASHSLSLQGVNECADQAIIDFLTTDAPAARALECPPSVLRD